MKRVTLISAVSILLLIPGSLFLGTRLQGRWYYLTCTLVILEAMLPFFLAFEQRKPQARELVILAVMSALAVAGRVAIPLPNFKAITAIIMLTGTAFGPQAGFMTGAVSAFASNFFYSQGPWTPWQMLSYGIGGFAAGLLFYRKPITRRLLAVMTVYGFLSVVLLVGPVLDLCTVFTTGSRITLSFVIAVLGAGFPHNLIHGLSCAATIALLGMPLLRKLNRMKTKYGIMDSTGT